MYLNIMHNILIILYIIVCICVLYNKRKLENYALWQMCREGRERKALLLPLAPIPRKLSVFLVLVFYEMPCFFMRPIFPL